MKIIFFGPPGSGKGTQAKLLAKELNILHLSTGDILREKLSDGDTLSAKLNQIMSSGNLVSDEILNEIIADKLMSEECINGFILDGYPRTISQLEFLLSFFKRNNLILDVIFNFKIDAYTPGTKNKKTSYCYRKCKKIHFLCYFRRNFDFRTQKNIEK